MSTYFSNLQGHSYMNLTTYRKTGEAVTTPVWFAETNGKLYVMTLNSAGKLKRLRHTTRVQVGPCNQTGKPLGPVVEATARILSDADGQRAKQVVDKKYGWQKKFFDTINRLGGKRQVYIEISLV